VATEISENQLIDFYQEATMEGIYLCDETFQDHMNAHCIYNNKIIIM
jgi:hypothetical protein